MSTETAKRSAKQAPHPTFANVEEAYAYLQPVMHAICAAVGDHCEVVLHDLTGKKLDRTIYAIVNGEVSGREVGGPSTNLGFDVLGNETADHNAFGYRGRTADGRELSSSSVYYRDHDGNILVALCINVDLSPAQAAINAISQLLPNPPAANEQPHEIIGPSIDGVLDSMLSDALATVGKPVPMMEKADRIEVLRLLETRGAFRIKRAAEMVASRLGVSRVTVYSYLDEVRRG